MDSGVVSTAHLLRQGWSTWEVEQAVQREQLRRLRRGWYALPHADPQVARAVAAGGVMSCISALHRQGVWVPVTSYLHVRTGKARPRRQPGIKFCPTHSRCRVPTAPVDPLPIALAAALRCLEFESRVVILDSILNLGLMPVPVVEQVVAQLHGTNRRLLEACDPGAQSGTETMVRSRLRNVGVDVRTQVSIPGVGRVDLMIGDRLVIEVDSFAHHTSLANYASDRERDRRLVALGFVVIRLTYHEVVYGWPGVEQDILAVIASGGHLRPA